MARPPRAPNPCVYAVFRFPMCPIPSLQAVSSSLRPSRSVTGRAPKGQGSACSAVTTVAHRCAVLCCGCGGGDRGDGIAPTVAPDSTARSAPPTSTSTSTSISPRPHPPRPRPRPCPDVIVTHRPAHRLDSGIAVDRWNPCVYAVSKSLTPRRGLRGHTGSRRGLIVVLGV